MVDSDFRIVACDLDLDRPGLDTSLVYGETLQQSQAVYWVLGKCYRACKLFNIRLYATLCFNYFRWHRRMFSYSSVFELLIC